MVVSDGDTIAATGMPKMPDSIAHVVIVGVGDPATGRYNFLPLRLVQAGGILTVLVLGGYVMVQMRRERRKARAAAAAGGGG